VLKLSLYGIFRLILPLLPKASLDFTYIIYLIGVITVIYASLSTLRTIDIKELIAYSSVAHAAVYLMGVFSNTIQGIEGGILLGLAHGFVSSGLFVCAGGILYDRTHTRLITYYRGVTQVMPLFSLLFFILCLGNSGTPLTLNFIGEFLSLYGVFERFPILGGLAASSIVLSAAYTFFMYNRIAFGGALSAHFAANLPDLTRREFFILLTLVVFTVLFGIYPSPILDGLHYSVSSLIYSTNEVGVLLPLYVSMLSPCLSLQSNTNNNWAVSASSSNNLSQSNNNLGQLAQSNNNLGQLAQNTPDLTNGGSQSTILGQLAQNTPNLTNGNPEPTMVRLAMRMTNDQEKLDKFNSLR
jgi:NADH-ubiquinone oxidoreductase chain 4